MTNKDLRYFHQRAEAELHSAAKATSPAASKVHYQLAGYYLDRIYGTAGIERLHAAN